MRFFCVASFGFFYKEQKRGKEVSSYLVENTVNTCNVGDRNRIPKYRPHSGILWMGTLFLRSSTKSQGTAKHQLFSHMQ